MAAARKREKKVATTSLQVNVESGTLAVEVLKNKSAARARMHVRVVDYNLPYDDARKYHNEYLVLPLFSLWIDPHNNDAFKFYAELPRTKAGLAMLTKFKLEGKVDYRQTYAFTTNRAGTILRFGHAAAQHHITDRESYGTIYFYESKAAAVTAILENVKQYQQVGGAELTNLNSVSDELLLNLGFIKLADELGQGQPCWMGSLDRIIGAGTGGGGGYYGNNSTKSKNVESFLNLLAVEVARS